MQKKREERRGEEKRGKLYYRDRCLSHLISCYISMPPNVCTHPFAIRFIIYLFYFISFHFRVFSFLPPRDDSRSCSYSFISSSHQGALPRHIYSLQSTVHGMKTKMKMKILPNLYQWLYFIHCINHRAN